MQTLRLNTCSNVPPLASPRRTSRLLLRLDDPHSRSHVCDECSDIEGRGGRPPTSAVPHARMKLGLA